MNRRAFLCCSMGASAFATLPGCHFSFEQGIFNPCASVLPNELADHPLVKSAWEGLKADAVWDCHVHLFGNGRSRTGIWVSPDFDNPTGIASKVRHTMFASGGCLGEDEALWDQRMVERLNLLIDGFPRGAKTMLLAFDFTYDPDGRRRLDLTTFSVPNSYAANVAKTRPERFEWIASVHPYRKDALDALAWCKANGARAVKWLPPSMAIDLASPRCIPFYEALTRLDLPLLSHVGEEKAVEGARRDELSNPLALRHPLDAGVRVIAAHCASMGESADTDADKDPTRAPQVKNFTLFKRLMNEARYKNQLYGDISAIPQLNRAEVIAEIIRTPSWHTRLLNGSDYPLPGIMPLFSLDYFVRQGMLGEAQVPILREIRNHNALLFDFVLKRSLRADRDSPQSRFPASVFETKSFFVP